MPAEWLAVCPEIPILSRMKISSLISLAAGSCLLMSCGDLMEVRTIKPKVKKKASKREPLPGVGGSPIKKNEGDGIQVGKTAADQGGYLPESVGGNVKVGGYTLPSDDDIVWSDDTNPEADIAFDKPFLKPVRYKGGWGVSFTEGRRESMRTGKPLVLWFTNQSPGKSPACKRLSAEVFSGEDFRKWAEKEIVRVRLDEDGGAELGLEQGDVVTRKRKYVKALKKRYKVLGLPAVVVMNPAGEVVEQYRGYRRGDKSYYWDRMKSRVLAVEHNHKIWRKKMKRKGYREWTGQNGRVIFAKLSRYSSSSGSIILIEPDGSKSRTNLSQLSQADKDWIMKEKAKRQKK